MRTILVVDDICPRGIAIIRYLSSTGEYHVLVFTRSTTCPGAAAVNTLPNVTLLLNRATTGYDLQTFAAAVQRCPNVLLCSSASNSEGKEGVQWGARLVQTAVTAGAKHLVFVTMERTRKQCSTDNYIHALGERSMHWTVIRSPVNGDAEVNRNSTNSAARPNDERALSTVQLQSLAQHVLWAFSNPSCSSGKDFVLPVVQANRTSATESKRRDSRYDAGSSTKTSYQIEGVTPHPDLRSAVGTSRNSSHTETRGSSAYLDSGRARSIQQWVASQPSNRAGKQKAEESSSEDEDEDEDSESESV